jgi:hypothetical protein
LQLLIVVVQRHNPDRLAFADPGAGWQPSLFHDYKLNRYPLQLVGKLALFDSENCQFMQYYHSQYAEAAREHYAWK